jgi:hypothetical protein
MVLKIRIYGTKQYYYFCGPINKLSNHDALENVSGKKVYIVFIKMFVLVKINLLKTSICSRFTKSNSLKRGYYLNIQPGNNFIACGFSLLIQMTWKNSKRYWAKPFRLAQNFKLKVNRDGFVALSGTQVPLSQEDLLKTMKPSI